MKTRVLSGCILAPLLLLVYFGGKVLIVGCFILGIMGLREFYRGFESLGIRPNHWVGYCATFVLMSIGLFQPLYGQGPLQGGTEFILYLFWVFAVMLASMLYLFRIEQRQPADGLATAFGVFYVVFFLYHVVLVDQSAAPILTWLIFLAAFGSDIMAYLVGRSLGRHKLCPGISPKKTVEGAVGGLFGSVLLCGLFGWFIAPEYFVHCLIIGLLGGAVSQLGDLSASIFKRKMGLKDFGNLIPGHGGVLDRFDSVLFVGPLVYYYIVIVIGFCQGYWS